MLENLQPRHCFYSVNFISSWNCEMGHVKRKCLDFIKRTVDGEFPYESSFILKFFLSLQMLACLLSLNFSFPPTFFFQSFPLNCPVLPLKLSCHRLLVRERFITLDVSLN